MNDGLREVTLGGVTKRLLQSEEPAVRYKVLTKVLDREPASVAVLREEIRASPRVRRLLSERGEDGKIPFHPYAKWYGAHWVLASLADIGYPPGDETLIPLREQVYGWLFSRSHDPDAYQQSGRIALRPPIKEPSPHTSCDYDQIYSITFK